jgi:hypothetical protein
MIFVARGERQWKSTGVWFTSYFTPDCFSNSATSYVPVMVKVRSRNALVRLDRCPKWVQPPVYF